MFTLDIGECHRRTNLTARRTSKPRAKVSLRARSITAGYSFRDFFDGIFLWRFAVRTTDNGRFDNAFSNLSEQKTPRFNRSGSTV